MNDELERMWKKAAMSSFKVLSRHFPGKTEEIHEKPQSESLVSRLIFEHGTSHV
jgi:hypothetical protein